MSSKFKILCFKGSRKWEEEKNKKMNKKRKVDYGHRMEESICIHIFVKGLVPTIYKKLLKLPFVVVVI